MVVLRTQMNGFTNEPVVQVWGCLISGKEEKSVGLH